MNKHTLQVGSSQPRLDPPYRFYPASHDIGSIANGLLIVFFLSFVTFAYASRHDFMPMMWMSHVMIVLLVGLHLYLASVRSRGSYFDASVLSFECLFLVLAPAIQMLTDNPVHVNTAVVEQWHGTLGNLAVVVFMVGYLWVRFRKPQVLVEPVKPVVSALPSDHPIVGIPLAGVSLVLAVVAYLGTRRLFQDYIVDGMDMLPTPSDLILRKTIFFLPVPIFLYLLVEKHKDALKDPLWLWVGVAALAGVLISQNPLIERRNALGPVYFTIAWLAMYRHQQPSPHTLFWTIFGVVGVMLPVVGLFTHRDFYSWTQGEPIGPVIYEHFASIHYDAWSNILSITEMVERYGPAMGHQILGALLFFVPRGMWADKPQPTGMEVGDYLTDHYAMWFNNLSAPLVGEGYLDFGYVGALVYGGLFAWFSLLADKANARRDNSLLKAVIVYLSFDTIFILRGSLMVGVAYGVGNLMAFLIVWLLIRVLSSHAKYLNAKPPLFLTRR